MNNYEQLKIWWMSLEVSIDSQIVHILNQTFPGRTP